MNDKYFYDEIIQRLFRIYSGYEDVISNLNYINNQMRMLSQDIYIKLNEVENERR